MLPEREYQPLYSKFALKRPKQTGFLALNLKKRADSFAIIISPKWGGILVTSWVGRCAIGWRGVMVMSPCGDFRRRAPFNANSIS